MDALYAWPMCECETIPPTCPYRLSRWNFHSQVVRQDLESLPSCFVPNLGDYLTNCVNVLSNILQRRQRSQTAQLKTIFYTGWTHFAFVDTVCSSHSGVKGGTQATGFNTHCDRSLRLLLQACHHKVNTFLARGRFLPANARNR